METIRSMDLHYRSGASDKVYHAAIIYEGGYYVNFAYGRRGNALTHGTKTTKPVTLARADTVFQQVVNEKVSKGYIISPGISGKVFDTPTSVVPVPTSAASTLTPASLLKVNSGILPQLCNEFDESSLSYLMNGPEWGMQEKIDGHRTLVTSVGGVTKGINKKGQFMDLPHWLMSAIDELPIDITLDGELVGELYYVFGMLLFRGDDFRGLEHGMVHSALKTLITNEMIGGGITLVPMAVTPEQKARLFEQIKKSGKEGVVFKRLAGHYTPGKPASGGDFLKHKFWAEASVVVTSINDKRSVAMGVLNPSMSKSDLTHVGSVTIPPNHDIPKVGQIIDVRYLYAYEGGSLYQPIYKGQRDDVNLNECLMSRLKFKAE